MFCGYSYSVIGYSYLRKIKTEEVPTD